MPLQLSHQKFILVCVIFVLYIFTKDSHVRSKMPSSYIWLALVFFIFFSIYLSANIHDMKKVKIATPTLQEWSVEAEAEADAWFICSCIIWFCTPANDVLIILIICAHLLIFVWMDLLCDFELVIPRSKTIENSPSCFVLYNNGEYYLHAVVCVACDLCSYVRGCSLKYCSDLPSLES